MNFAQAARAEAAIPSAQSETQEAELISIKFDISGLETSREHANFNFSPDDNVKSLKNVIFTMVEKNLPTSQIWNLEVFCKSVQLILVPAAAAAADIPLSNEELKLRDYEIPRFGDTIRAQWRPFTVVLDFGEYFLPVFDSELPTHNSMGIIDRYSIRNCLPHTPISQIKSNVVEYVKQEDIRGNAITFFGGAENVPGDYSLDKIESRQLKKN